MVPSNFQFNTLLEIKRFGVSNYYLVPYILKQHPTMVNVLQITNYIYKATEINNTYLVLITLKNFQRCYYFRPQPTYVLSNIWRATRYGFEYRIKIKAFTQTRHPGFPVATQSEKTHRKAIHQNTVTHRSVTTTVISFILCVCHIDLTIQWPDRNQDPLYHLAI